MREGWWYESGEAIADAAETGLCMLRLQDVAKASGDAAARGGDWQGALEHYFSAMEIAWRRKPGRSIDLGTLHSNASLACLKLKKHDDALDHAQTTVNMRPTWGKAHARCARALESLGRHAEAVDAYAAAEKYAATRREAAEFNECHMRTKCLLDGARGQGEESVRPHAV